MKQFDMQFRVRYAETDAMGIVHHAVYPVWFEMGRTEYLREVGIPYREMESRGLQSPVIAIHVRYLKPARYDDLLTLKVRVARYTGVRLTLHYEVYRDDVLLCTGESEHAFLNEGRATAVQRKFEDIHEMLARCVGEA